MLTDGFRPISFVFRILLLLLLPAGTAVRAQSLQVGGSSNRFLTLQHSETAVSDSAFTLEAWVYTSDWRRSYYVNTIFSTEDPVTQEGFVLRAGGSVASPHAHLNFVIKTYRREESLVTPPLLVPNRWQHVAVTVDRHQATVYIDGQPVAQRALLSAFVPGKLPVRIGSAYFPGRMFTGALDEVRIWNTCRTASEINHNRTIPLQGTERGLVVYLPMTNTVQNKANPAVRAVYQPEGEPVFAPGFSLPRSDAGIAQIDGPDVFAAGQRRVQVTIRNYGGNAVSRIPLIFRVNGKEVLRDTLRRTLASGESCLFTTQTPVLCTPTDTSELVVCTALEGDTWVKNDSCRVVYRPIRTGPGRKSVLIMDRIRHNLGTEGHNPFHYTHVPLPTDYTRFSRILMNISLDCPQEGCDDWDAVGQIFLRKNGQTYELGRFVTPYGVGCGPWAIDVTDFKSVLTGDCVIESRIDTWNQKGWLLSVSFEFIESGPNPFPYHKITPLWANDYLIYGDPAVDHRLRPVTYQPGPQARVITVRHVTTGHGQGNTDNAGEYARKTHELIIRQAGEPDSLLFKQLLWKNDCDRNTCTRQNGAYIYSRAGWCPGQDVRPWVLNLPLTDRNANPEHALLKNVPLTLEYRLQPYVNLKNTGYDRDQHTEPVIRIYGYLIEKSDSLRGFITSHNVACQSLTVVDGFVQVTITNTGTEPAGQIKLHVFADGTRLTTEAPPGVQTLLPGETRTVRFSKQLLSGRHKSLSVVAVAEQDDHAGDDVATFSENPFQPDKKP